MMVTGRLPKMMSHDAVFYFIFGEYKHFPIKLFRFSYSTGGRNKSTYKFTVTEITLRDGTFPYLLLHNNKSKKHQNADYFGDDKDIRISLGTHDTTYSLYTTKNYEVEALQICTPEFIELIASSYLPLSVEFAENHIYIYTPSDLHTEKDLDEMYRITKTLIDTFGDFLMRMKDDYQALHEVYKK